MSFLGDVQGGSNLDNIVGAFDGLFGETLNGWAINLSNPDKYVSVRLVVDGITAGETIADIFRKDLESNPAAGKSGFRLPVPKQFQDGKMHIVSVIANGANLKNSPQEIKLSTSNSKPLACVITQALSSGYFFPKWYSYYASQVGAENIYVLTDCNSKHEFDGWKLGGVISYPGNIYDEHTRINMTSSIAAGLLECYQCAIVVDSDELAIPDPRKYKGLTDYLIKTPEVPYTTCIGIDIVQRRGEEKLDLERNILGEQRRYGYLTSSLSKTSIVRKPVKWGVGYHYCTVYPRFNDVFLFHLKRSDMDIQFNWMERMSRFDIPTQLIKDYYSPERAKIEAFVDTVSSWEIVSGWQNMPNMEFVSDYYREIKLDVNDNVYRGKHFQQKKLVTFPEEFHGLF